MASHQDPSRPYEMIYHDPNWSRWRSYHFTLNVTEDLFKEKYCNGFSDGYLEYSELEADGRIYRCKWRLIRAEINSDQSQIEVYVRTKSPKPWLPFFLYNLRAWLFGLPIPKGGGYGTGGIKVVGSSATGSGGYGGKPPAPSAHEDLETFAIPPDGIKKEAPPIGPP